MKRVALIDEESKPNPTIIELFDSIIEAEQWIANYENIDASKVHRGGFGIDAPEEFFN